MPVRKAETKRAAEVPQGKQKTKKPARAAGSVRGVPAQVHENARGVPVHENVRRVSYAGKEIIIIGTAHISAESISLVRSTIEAEHPDAVGVELDAQRYAQLKSGERWGETNISHVISSGQSYLFLINLLLANLQRQLGQKVGIKPGEEMLQAARIAEERGIPVALIDRDVRVTLKRAMDVTSLGEKTRLLVSIFSGFFGSEKDMLTPEKIEELKKHDIMSELMQQLSREMPNVKRVLVDERDLYIANRILAMQGRKIVAVVGAGHLGGILQYLDAPRDTAHLNALPKKKFGMLQLIAYSVPLLFFALIAYALVTKGAGVSLNILAYWFLINGTLAALGVLLARGHVFSIITAFVAAPFTTLHPLLAVGWFAGAMEAKMRNPKVKDFEGLRNLNSYSDFAKNSVTRILLVAAFANLGATIGTLIALPYILAMLA